mmetsp:Transcript_4806/g.11733  ORF Transcript_4806/g.11733 Transcript_4806/m.11733 type:complete len:363 (-) Transcript_4806:106-1194(-)
MAFYSILDISCDASPEECRKAFRHQALKWHPDKSDHPESEERFKQIQRAWRILSEPMSREAYDARLRLGIDDGIDDDKIDGPGDGCEASSPMWEDIYSEDIYDDRPDGLPTDQYATERRRHNECMLVMRVVCFVCCAALAATALWIFAPATALFPVSMHASNRQFGRHSLNADFRAFTASLVAEHISRQPWFSNVAASLVRTHTPYLRLDVNRTDLQTTTCESFGCPKMSLLLKTPRRVGHKTHSIFTFMQADPLHPPMTADGGVHWPPRGASDQTSTFCIRLYRSGSIIKKPWFDSLKNQVGRLRPFRLVAVSDAECKAHIGLGAIVCSLLLASAFSPLVVGALAKLALARPESATHRKAS